MKLTLSWLQEFLDFPSDDPGDIAESFERLGHEVEEWHLIEPSFTGVVIGHVLEISAHPDADKVRLTKVDVGSEVLDIICGASNFEVGAIVPVAVPGAMLAGDFEIGSRDIRGVTSHGMICSESELELGTESDGIMVLNTDYPNAASRIGEPLDEVIGVRDVFYEVAVTPDRPDCLSVYGLARDLAGLYDVALSAHDFSLSETGETTDVVATVESPETCPRFAGRQVRGITVGVSPHWLRRRLGLAGVRPISNVVDASNYAMIEFGHPTHAFDVQRLGPTISVRMAAEGETIVTLDGQERTLGGSDVIVTDGTHAIAIGGVMGGQSTEVHEETTDVFIEAAYWDPAHVLLTSKRLGLRSEASARFERGADPSFCNLAADRVAQILVEIAGGLPAPLPVDVNPGNISPWTVTYPLSETKRILGISLDSAATTELLARRGFSVTGSDPLTVTVPTRRPDVRAPVDLVEEIARLHGFDAIPDSVPHGPGRGLSYQERRLRLIRNVMVGAGFNQIIGFSFVGEHDLANLYLDDSDPLSNAITITNPLNETENVMRTTLLPGLLKAASTALARKNDTARLYEIGKVFLPRGGTLPEQPDRLAFVLAGRRPSTWLESGKGFDHSDGTGVWTVLTDTLGLKDARVREAALAPYDPGRCAEILIGETVIGTVGEIHRSVASSFELTGRVVAAEFDLDMLLATEGPWQFTRPSVFPPVVFDLAFLLDTSVASSVVIDAVGAAEPELVEDVSVFDVFSGSSLGEGRKSVAIRIRLRASDRTLSDEDVAPILKVIADGVVNATGGELRGTA